MVAERSPKNSQFFPEAARAHQLMQKPAKRSDAGTRPDHDDGCVVIHWQPKLQILMDVNGQTVIRLHSVGKHRRTDSTAFTIVRAVANNSHCGVDLVRVS